MEIEFRGYLRKKMNEIDNKIQKISKVNVCMGMKDYYERFCDRKDNPTFNMIEVELKR